MHVSFICVQGSWSFRKDSQISCSWSYRQFNATSQTPISHLLEKLHILNYWPISPAPLVWSLLLANSSFLHKLCSFLSQLSLQMFIGALLSIHITFWILHCLQMSLLKEITPFHFSSASYKFSGHMQTEAWFFFLKCSSSGLQSSFIESFFSSGISELNFKHLWFS